MNVASLELSKELYELSGWNDIEWGWFDTDNDTHWRLVQYGGEADVAPAYDLGYLQRKLRHVAFDKPGRFTDLAVTDEPENYLAFTAIELFKQGVLKKEQS